MLYWCLLYRYTVITFSLLYTLTATVYNIAIAHLRIWYLT